MAADLLGFLTTAVHLVTAVSDVIREGGRETSLESNSDFGQRKEQLVRMQSQLESNGAERLREEDV
jgi:hypothetical protein